MSVAGHEPSSESARRLGDVDEFLSVSALVTPWWRARWFIVAVTLVFAVGAAFASRFMPKQYQASVVVAPVAEGSGSSQLGALGAIASQFGGGGLASLLGGQSGDRRGEMLAILQSESLTTEFIDRNKLLPILYAEKWDAARNAWKESDPSKVPTLWKANQLFRKQVRGFSTDVKTGLSSLTITWQDPRRAAQWANGLVALENDYVRRKAIAESERNIAYLNEQLAKSNVVAVQNSISALLENEIKKEMLARGSDEYALKVIDAATVPERASAPITLFWALLGFLCGLLLSCGAVSIRDVRRRM
jgi:uncharacterized protein involved in exopolysaccharide biosynthesis